jgi:replicative DNA helicase
MSEKKTLELWSFEAEASVLSALMLDASLLDTVIAELKPEMFFDVRHREIFNAIARLCGAGKPVDAMTVFGELSSTKDFGITLQDLRDVEQFAPTAYNAEHYAQIVAERALTRAMVLAATKAREIATAPDLTASERLDKCQDEFQQLAARRVTREPKPVGDFALGMIDRINDLADGLITPGIRSRIPTLDRLLGGGFKPGKQIVLAARPSVGKSALAMEFAYACADQGHPSAFLSMEMEGHELAERLASRIGAVGMGSFNTGKLTDPEWSGLSEAVEAMRTLPVYIDDQPGLTLGDIQAKARKLSRERGIKLLVIDYLQLCAPSSSTASRHHQIEEISRGLKVLAKQLGITTVVLSQLNREVEKRPGGRPSLADLKESGAIEEDADTVILLSADGTRGSGDVVVHAELAKNRGGAKGFVKLAFTGVHQRFVETIVQDNEFNRAPQTRGKYAEDF